MDMFGPNIKVIYCFTPFNTEVLLRSLLLCGKSRSMQGLLESNNKIGGSYVIFFRDN